MNAAFPPEALNLLLPSAAVFFIISCLNKCVEDINETKEGQGATPAEWKQDLYGHQRWRENKTLSTFS